MSAGRVRTPLTASRPLSDRHAIVDNIAICRRRSPHLRYLIGPQVFPCCHFRQLLPRIPSMLPGAAVSPGGRGRLGKPVAA